MLKRLLSCFLGLFFMGGMTGVTSEDAAIRTFCFQYAGMALPMIGGIDARTIDNGMVATLLLGEYNDVPEIILGADEVQALEKLVHDYNLRSWAGFDDTRTDVLDGESFFLSASFLDGTTVLAHGNNAFPAGYDEAKDAIIRYAEDVMTAHYAELWPESETIQ